MSLSTADPGSSKNLLHQAWCADLSLDGGQQDREASAGFFPPELTTQGFHLQRGWGEETKVSAHLQLAVLHTLQKSTQSMLCTADLSGLRRLSSSRLVWAVLKGCEGKRRENRLGLGLLVACLPKTDTVVHGSNPNPREMEAGGSGVQV